MLRKSLALPVSVIALSAAGLFAAPPAQAAVYTVNYAVCDQANLDGQTISVPEGDTLRITFTTCPNFNLRATSSSGFFGASATVGSNAFYIDSSGTQRAIEGTAALGGGRPPLVSGTYVVYFSTVGGPVTPQGSFTVIVGGGGGDSSSSSAAAPQTIELALNPQDGTTCTNSSESGTGGTWITLPSASDCTPPPSKPSATLLGWATSPNFPVEIAQRQVDNGWGAYEAFNADGQLTGVFIPAGGATFLSAAGNIYPIWSQ